MSQHVRLQIEIAPEEMAELERLGRLGGSRTKKDVVNNAITLLKWAARERGGGCTIVSLNRAKGTIKELEMPFLETVAARAVERD
jgi:hypothetical protein